MHPIIRFIKDLLRTCITSIYFCAFVVGTGCIQIFSHGRQCLQKKKKKRDPKPKREEEDECSVNDETRHKEERERERKKWVG